MKSAVRRGLGKNTYRFILWFTLLGLVGTSIIFLPFRRLGLSADAVATVNGSEISLSLYRSRLRDIQRQIEDVRRSFGSMADMFLEQTGLSGDPQTIALQQLVERLLLTQAASKMGIYAVSPAYAQRKMGDSAYVMHFLSDLIPPYFLRRGGGIDVNGLRTYLMRQGISREDFERLVEEGVKNALVISLLPTAVYVPGVEKERELQVESADRDFTVLTLDLSSYRDRIKKEGLDDKTLQAFFDEENKATRRYWKPEVRTGTVWTFSLPDYDIQVSEDEIRRAYADKRKDLGEKTFEQAKDEVKKLLVQEKFARRFTADTKNFQMVGDNNDAAFKSFVSKYKGVSKPVEKSNQAAWNLLSGLHTVGQRRAYVEGDKGYLVSIDHIEPRVSPAFSEVKATVLEDLATHRARVALEKELDSLLEKSRTEKDFLEKARQVPGITVTEYSHLLPGSEGWRKLEHLPLKRMKRMIHPGYAIKHMNDKGGALVYLKRIGVPQAKDTQQLTTTLFRMGEGLVTAAFVDSLRNSATIKYREIRQTRV